MQNPAETFIPILFEVLFGLVVLNMIITFSLHYAQRTRSSFLLATYWPALLSMYLLQGSFQEGGLNTILAFSPGMFVSGITGMISFESIGRKYPWKSYLPVYFLMYPITLWLNSMALGFTTVALPIAIAAALGPFHGFYLINIQQAKSTTRLQKVFGIILLLNAIHSVNFAIFRMDPGAQLWGWIVSFSVCNAMAIFLPSIILQQNNLSEKARLTTLVEERTAELTKSLKMNDNLFKVLVHDISNPLMVMKGYTHLLAEENNDQTFLLEKVQKSQLSMENIINQVKSLHRLKNNDKIPLEAVAMEECFREVSLIFDTPLKKKNITLKLKNNLPTGCHVLADQISLTHSVLSNLISNAIKFNNPDSVIEIQANEINNKIILEVKDQGPGIPENIIDDIFSDRETISSIGTMGEKGTGLGLSIVKSFVDSYGGEFEIDTTLLQQSKDFGTNVRITLDRA